MGTSILPGKMLQAAEMRIAWIGAVGVPDSPIEIGGIMARAKTSARSAPTRMRSFSIADRISIKLLNLLYFRFL
jgi:hypothetical protein